MNIANENLQMQIRNFYARQAHLIDKGQHDAWANTFTPTGEFHSPTYGEPAVGFDNLRAISVRFATSVQAAGENHHHLMQNIWVREVDAEGAKVQSYMLIVSFNKQAVEVKPLRLVTIDDDLVCTDGVWQVARREVTY